jgi:hypothetical protein
MAMGLYDPAFATLACLYGRAARGPITGITLVAGFASTVDWPLSGLLEVLRKLLSERIAVVSTQSSRRRSCDGSDDAAAASMHDRQHDRSQPLASKPTILRLRVAK